MRVRDWFFVVLFLLPGMAMAHTGVGSTHGFEAGLRHPLGGLDHILAMVAVGLWASQLGGRSIWLVPVAFVFVMAVGGALAMFGIRLPYIESGILVSVIVLGLLIAGGVRVPVSVGVILVGIFALFHGAAHGAEMPRGASGYLYASGFMLATAGLHLAGVLGGLMLGGLSLSMLTRACGLVVAGYGVFLLAR